MVAATRLHQALLACGVDSHFACILQDEEGTNVHVLPEGTAKRCLFLSLAKLTRCMWKFSHHRRSIPLNVVPLFGLEKLLKRLNPDVVHVHWIYSDVCSYEQLARLPYRLIVNLHDLYMVNGIDLHPESDTRFQIGFTKENSSWVERWIFGRKRLLVNRNVARFIAPSEWVASMCRRSLIGCEVPVDVIGNIPRLSSGLERDGFMKKTDERFVILFGAWGGRGNHYKGFADLEKALALLPPEVKGECELHVFGEQAADCETTGVRTHFLGVLETDADFVGAFGTADVLAFPSRIETQGMTKVEALLAGLPVVAFVRTACAEGLENGVNSRVVEDGDIRGFANGLLAYFGDWKAGRTPSLRMGIAEHANRIFNVHALCEKILSSYERRP